MGPTAWAGAAGHPPSMSAGLAALSAVPLGVTVRFGCFGDSWRTVVIRRSRDRHEMGPQAALGKGDLSVEHSGR